MSVALVLVCGLPAIGKGTLCRALVAAAVRRDGVEAVHIEFDAAINATECDTHADGDDSWRAARERVAVEVERRVCKIEGYACHARVARSWC
jgi:broad-specificity NMP kinase